MKRLFALALAALFVLAACDDDGPAGPDLPGDGGDPTAVAFWLTVLHNNDGESDLLVDEEFGGIAHFATLVESLKQEGMAPPPMAARVLLVAQDTPGAAAILVSSGDNFLAGPEFNVSLETGVPFFDAIALDLIGYDALAIGNHEFDFGPDVLADFIESFTMTMPPFLSANLDFSAEPRLSGLAAAGKIAESTVVEKEGTMIGIIGATTPDLRSISSPRDVMIQQDVAAQVMMEVTELETMGVNIIVLISHLQDLGTDLSLIPMLDGVDVVVAGGGDELLANADDELIPGDMPAGPYPTLAMNGDGTEVPVVTTPGEYEYIGRLIVGFNSDGEIVEIHDDSGPVRVAAGTQPDAVPPDPTIQAQVVTPIEMGVADLAANVIGTSEVPLDGVRQQVRTVETNLGNLIADALLWQAEQLAGSFGVVQPDVALQNGGGIRNDDVLPAGPVTELDTFEILPFTNFVSVIPGVSRAQFKDILENAVRNSAEGDDGSSGRFAQVAGFSFEWDPAGTRIELDTNGDVVIPGSRIVEVTLDDGTEIVVDGVVQTGSDLAVATIDFLARGGDEYPFRGADFTTLGVTYQQALENYIVMALGGVIPAAEYPEGGEGRIVRVP